MSTDNQHYPSHLLLFYVIIIIIIIIGTVTVIAIIIIIIICNVIIWLSESWCMKSTYLSSHHKIVSANWVPL